MHVPISGPNAILLLLAGVGVQMFNVPVTSTWSPENAVAVTVTGVPDWAFVGAADRVMVFIPFPTLNAVDVVLTVPSVAPRTNDPAVDGIILVKYAIPDVFVVSLSELAFERDRSGVDDNVTRSPEIGNPLPPKIRTSAVVAIFTLVGEGSPINDADTGVIATISTVGLPHCDEMIVSPSPQRTEHRVWLGAFTPVG